MECVIEAVVTKRLGALPVAAEFLRRLDVKDRKPPRFRWTLAR